ncbi:hypothetical protein ACFUMH_02520 [Cellulomonas sp. NPDC057328]|uniref:hypothetical protein n=1 Tax=Cellulomonas sp. NPDC057328 TaxID=3346101 RepID=UPI003626D250
MRTTTTARAVVRTVLTGAVAGTTALLVAPPSAAEPPVVPADAVTWFADEAAALIAESQEGAVTTDREAVIGYVGVQVGTPVALTAWTREFIAGTTGAAPTAALEQWVAPLTRGGEPVGVVSAFRDRGRVGLAFFDDDASLAAALQALPDDATVVFDAPLDAYFLHVPQGIAPLSESSRAEIASRVPVEQFQEQLEARHGDAARAPAVQAPPTDPRSAMAGGGATVPPGARADAAPAWLLPVGAAVAAAGAGVLLHRGLRRRGRGTTATRT